MNEKVYQIITDRIIKKLEQGVVPWQRPWALAAGGDRATLAHRNGVSGKPYRGINAMLTACSGYASPFWFTYKQAQELGGQVKRGEQGTPVVFWRQLEVKDNAPTAAADATKRIPMMRYYTVFNLEQIEGLDLTKFQVPAAPRAPEFSPIEEAEKIVAGFKTMPRLVYEKQRAFYSPSLDYINMPVRGSFDTAENFYCTLFHEMTHSTGHESRLARKELQKIVAFGDHSYSQEELTAEMGAAFLCGLAGIESTIEQSAAYIGNWLSKLRNDPKFVVQAAARAQKAADYILGIEAQASEDAA